MAEWAERRLVTLVMDGADEHHGHVTARALVDKLDRFLRTFAAFERAYLGARSRRTDFEVVTMSHNSPTNFGLHPIPLVKNYVPFPAVNWTLAQWDKIVKREQPNSLVDDELVRDVEGLATNTERCGVASFLIKYNGFTINFGQDAANNAKMLRLEMQEAQMPLPWRPGVSQGAVTGELRSVLDAESEHQIVVCPFFGAPQIRCKFNDAMRELIRENLWSVVKVSGILHYGASGPDPLSIDIDLRTSQAQRRRAAYA